jgi:type IV secretory pathway TraG/TraD family ATPase VirD4
VCDLPQDKKMTNQEEVREREALVILYILGAAVVACILWIAHKRLYLTNQQLVEISLWFILAGFLLVSTIRHFATKEARREEIWPKTSPVIPAAVDRKSTADAAKADKVLIGYRTDGTPFSWSNSMRSMQGICFGQSGSGKTTLLESITQQDIRRGCPIIFLDGKGDNKLFEGLLPVIDAAGRTHQLRVIDPQHPEHSVSYNPLWVPEGVTPEAQVAFIFDSFQMNSNDFFDAHQRVYLENIVRILHYSGRRFNFRDVMVTAYDTAILKRQVQIAMAHTANPSVSIQDRQALIMTLHVLAGTFEDKERVAKIQGLINHLNTFMAREMAMITGPYENVLTLDDVIDNNLILYLSLNANINGTAVTSLGRIVLQNLQLMIGRRYAKSHYDTKHSFVSVIMDEFAPFAYEEFAQIINQARGTNVGFLFSLQSAPQLLQVGKSFRSDLSSAPNTTFMLRAKDDETADMFLQQTSVVKQVRRSVQYAKTGIFSPKYEEQDTGTQTEVYDTASKDEHLKRMPTGQLEALVTDHRQGAVLEHVHVRRSEQSLLIESPTAALYPALAVRRKKSPGLNLEFSALPFQQSDNRNIRRPVPRGGRS